MIPLGHLVALVDRELRPASVQRAVEAIDFCRVAFAARQRRHLQQLAGGNHVRGPDVDRFVEINHHLVGVRRHSVIRHDDQIDAILQTEPLDAGQELS